MERGEKILGAITAFGWNRLKEQIIKTEQGSLFMVVKNMALADALI